MSVRTAVTLNEYLHTSYEYEPEFVDGELVERSMPSLPHARKTVRISSAFESSSSSTKLYAAIDVRLRVTPTRYRIPDISILADAVPDERYPSKPPFGVIEILSPDDSLSDLSRNSTNTSGGAFSSSGWSTLSTTASRATNRAA